MESAANKSDITDGCSPPRSVNCALRPDAQGFDEIRIVTVPRWKESELSGDEWRISARIEFIRNEIVFHSVTVRDVEAAAGMLYGEMVRALDAGAGWFAGDGLHCDQEGCAALATRRYEKLKHFERDGFERPNSMMQYRHFCEMHRVRGDCALDDADRNYLEVPFMPNVAAYKKAHEQQDSE